MPAWQVPSPHLVPLAARGCTQPLRLSHASTVQGLPSLHTFASPGAHLPPIHASLSVHTEPSEHGTVLALWAQSATASHESVVQISPSSQLFEIPATQLELLQKSLIVHTLLSLQPPALAANTQPLALLQLSSVHTLPSSQPSAEPPKHVPPLQASLVVHALPSLQGAELLATTQPLLTSQLSSVQGFKSLQTLGLPGTHLPPEQVSSSLQTLSSVHGSALLTLMQPCAASHKSVVHTLPSSQTLGPPEAHLPSLQLSPSVQMLASEHGAVLLTATQPFLVSQLSVVQPLLSSHALGLPGSHTPSKHASPSVQALLSVQLPVL